MVNVESTPAVPAEPARRPLLSHVLKQMADGIVADRVSLADVMRMLRGRSYGALVTFFGTPLILPHVPGLSTILGVPLLFLTGQLAVNRRMPYLPGFIADRSVTREDFQKTIQVMVPWLARAEAVLRPRWKPLTGRIARQAMGVMSLLLAIILVLPIPFGNMLPGLAITFFGLAILARDGLFALAGWGTAVVSIAVVGGVAWAALLSITALSSWLGF